MAFTTPGTAVAGEVLTAAFWNEQVRDNLANLRALANVQSTTITTTKSVTGTTFVDIADMTVTITPTSTASKIMVFASLHFGCSSASDFVLAKIVRDSTDIFIGDAAGSRTRTSTAFMGQATTTTMDSSCLIHLDAPNKATATTYKIQWRTTGAASGYLNRSGSDGDSASTPRAASSITVWEIPA